MILLNFIITKINFLLKILKLLSYCIDKSFFCEMNIIP